MTVLGIRRPRWLPLLLIALLLAAGFGLGCAGPQAQPAESKATPPEGFVTLRVLTFGQDSTLDAVINQFYERYPQYRISKRYLPYDGQDPVAHLSRIIGSGEADLLQVDGYGAALAGQGLLRPLDPLIGATGFDLRPLGDVLPALQENGRVYELPTVFQPQVLAYSPALFQAAGVPEPPSTGWTWEEFRNTARQVRGERDGAPVWGFSAPLVEPLVQTWLLDRTSAPAAVTPEELREALLFFRAMVFDDGAIPVAERRRWGQPGAILLLEDDFAAGRAAMGMVSLPPLSRPRNAWEMAPFPTRDGQPFPLEVIPRTYAIAATSRQPEAAFAFLRFMAGEEGAVIAASAGRVPVYQSKAVREAWFRQKPAPPASTELLFSLPRVMRRPRTGPADAEYIRRTNGAINQVLSGSAPVEQVYETDRKEVSGP